MAVSLTEDEWLTTTDDVILWESDYLRGKVSDRKYQLYAVAWCRRIWDLFPTDQARRVVETLERVADGITDEEQLEQLEVTEDEDDPHAGLPVDQSHALSAAVTCRCDKGYRLAEVAASYCLAAIAARAGQHVRDYAAEGWAQCELIRELFANPFRLPALDPRWLTADVVGLARTAYDGPAFDLLPVLADALEDAWCDNPDILAHCRGPGPHVRGCWVVDLVLGKA